MINQYVISYRSLHPVSTAPPYAEFRVIAVVPDSGLAGKIIIVMIVIVAIRVVIEIVVNVIAVIVIIAIAIVLDSGLAGKEI